MTRTPLATARESADPIDVETGTRLRLRRKELRISQTELGEHLGLSFQQIQKYEQGINRISASMLVRAAEKLGCSVSHLVGEDDPITLRKNTGLFERLEAEGAMDLLAVYSRIPPRWRPMLLDIARTLARTGRDADADPAP